MCMNIFNIERFFLYQRKQRLTSLDPMTQTKGRSFNSPWQAVMSKKGSVTRDNQIHDNQTYSNNALHCKLAKSCTLF